MLAPIPASGSSASRQRWFFLGLLAFFLLINIQYLVKVHYSERETRSAFARWRPQLQELERGKNIWAKHNYPNPPIMALILMPFIQLPSSAGALAWFYFKVALTVLAIYGVFSMLDRPDRPFPFWGKALAVVLSLRPIQGDLTHGNVNLFILFLVVASLIAFSQKRDVLAGLALALGIACKVTPALFLPYLVWKRAWKTLAASACGLVLFLFVVPGLSFGWGRNLTYLQSWHEVMVKPFVVEGMITSEHQNQSLPGLLTRLLTHAPSFADYDDNNQFIPTDYHNIADLDRTIVPWIVKACMAVFAGLVLWRCRAPTLDRTHWKLWAEFSIVVLGMLLFSERTWKHHAVTLLLPFVVLAYLLSSQALSRGQRGIVLTALGLASGLMLSTSTGFWDTHDLIGKSAQVYGAYVWAFLVLATTLFMALGWELPDPSARGRSDADRQAGNVNTRLGEAA